MRMRRSNKLYSPKTFPRHSVNIKKSQKYVHIEDFFSRNVLTESDDDSDNDDDNVDELFKCFVFL